MSVSDDSKMKLIETKYQILYTICTQIKDKDFQRTLSLTGLKHRNEDIYKLVDKYKWTALKTEFNAEVVHKELYQTLKEKCVNALQLMSGQDVDTDHMSDTDIQALLASKLDVLSTRLTEAEEVSKCVDKNFKIYQNGKFDLMLLYQTMVETENILRKYGNKEMIERLKDDRKALESEGYRLKSDLIFRLLNDSLMLSDLFLNDFLIFAHFLLNLTANTRQLLELCSEAAFKGPTHERNFSLELEGLNETNCVSQGYLTLNSNIFNGYRKDGGLIRAERDRKLTVECHPKGIHSILHEVECPSAQTQSQRIFLSRTVKEIPTQTYYTINGKSKESDYILKAFSELQFALKDLKRSLELQ
ncbi:unnamed protein product, partial [Oppiella nova]